MNIIKKYIKNINNIKSDFIKSSHLPKSKLYLKIIGLPYLLENNPISPDIIISIFKESHIFNNIILASKPYIIKVLPKPNIAVVWINIWDLQSGSAINNIINWWFNIEQYITTIYSTNMKSSILQCKNCWKWEHSTLSYCSYISRYTKYNGTHLTKHYRENVWCYKENKNFNRSATKEEELCPHIFKCANCKENYQADSYTCLFWYNHFNRNWHSRKQQELFQK